MAMAVVRARDTLRDVPWFAHPALLALGIVAHAVVLSAGCRVWWMLLERVTPTRITARELWRTWAMTNPTRYVPGRIWHVGSLGVLLRDAGVPPAATLASIVVHMWLYSLAACAVALIALIGSPLGSALGAMIAVATLSAIAVGTHPRVLRSVIVLAARLARQSSLEWRCNWTTALGFVAIDVVVHIATGVAVAMVLIATLGLEPSSIARIVSSNAASFLAGYVSLAPVGIGVREAVMTLLLKPALPIGRAAIAAVVARIVLMVSELLLAVAAVAIRPAQRLSTGA